MRKVNIHEAKTTLSQLVEAAENGETVVLARAGKPVAKLTRYTRPAGVRLGVLKGKLPAGLVAEIDRPFTAGELATLFGSPVEPSAGGSGDFAGPGDASGGRARTGGRLARHPRSRRPRE